MTATATTNHTLVALTPAASTRNRIIPAVGADALLIRNSDPFTMAGGSHFVYPANTLDMFEVDSKGNLYAGPNPLLVKPFSGTIGNNLPTFLWRSDLGRLYIGDGLSLGRLADPPDIYGLRAGPETGYPSGVGNGATATGTCSVPAGTTTPQTTITGALSAYLTEVFPGEWVTIGAGATFYKVASVTNNTTIVLDTTTPYTGAAVSGQTLTVKIGSPARLTGVGAGSNVFELRGGAMIVPFGGTVNTIGATRPSAPGATFYFQTAEIHRDLTGFTDLALGMHARLQLYRIGYSTGRDVLMVRESGELRLGNSAIGETNSYVAKLYIRGSSGANEKQRVTITGTPTGGTFTLTHYGAPDPAGTAYVGAGETTAPIAYNATAADVKTALEALASIGAGNITATVGPLPGASVTVEWSGATVANTNYVRLHAVGSLTGGTAPAVSTSIVQDGDPIESTRDMFGIHHSGSTGTPTGDYFWLKRPDGNKIARFDGNANFLFGLSADAASGTGVIALKNATANPSGTPASGTVVYAASGALAYKDSSGTAGAVFRAVDRRHQIRRLEPRAVATAITGAATYVADTGQFADPTTTGHDWVLIYLDSADFAIIGQTTKLRLTAGLIANDTAPGITMTVGLYPVGTPSGGAAVTNPNVGTVVSGSTVAFVTPAANSKAAPSSSTDFTFPSTGWYTIAMASSGAMTASSQVVFQTLLEAVYS